MDKKKKNCKGILLIIFIAVVIVIAFSLNVYYACASGSDANIFTAIGGWLGFLATALIGGITLYQNKLYSKRALEQNELFDQRQQRQYEIEQLVRYRERVFNQYKEFENKFLNYDILYTQAKMKKDNSNEKMDFVALTGNLSNFVLSLIYGLTEIRYNYEMYINLTKKYFELNDKLLEITKDCFNFELEKQLEKICSDIQFYYNKLLISIDDSIVHLQEERLSYDNFMLEVFNLKNVKELLGIIKNIELEYTNKVKENEDGQTKNANK